MKDILKKIQVNKLIFLIVVVIVLFIKSFLFTAIATSFQGQTISKVIIDMQLLPAYLSMIIIIVSPALFFKGRGQVIYLLVVDVIYTIIMVADLIIYRGTSCYIGLKNIFNPELFNPANNFIFKYGVLDFIIALDVILLLIILLFGCRVYGEFKRNSMFAMITIVICSGVVYQIEKNTDFMQYQWVDYASMEKMFPLGYHYFEAKDTLTKKFGKTNEEDYKRVDEWLEWNNEDLQPNEYMGIFKDKNVIYIQAESLETFVIGQTVNGQEITPVLNNIVNGGLYFPNMYEQNSGGNSVDADLMVNASIFTLEDSIAFLSDPEPVYPSMPRILGNLGYTSNTLHVIKSAEYRWAENHKHSLGFENVWDIKDFDLTYKVGNFYSDRELFEQQFDKVKDLDKPFFSMIPTTTSHGPFYMEPEFKYLNLTDEQNESRLGEYFQAMKYLDTQIGYYLSLLDREGILDNSVIAIFGDHGGVHKYYREMIEDAPFEGDWWKEDNMTLPFLLYSPEVEPKTIDTVGGLVDVMPTVLYTLGIEPDYLMGRNLLNTERNATVYTNREKERTIVGEVKSEEEREKLLEAYDISNIIIKQKYYENRDINIGK